MKKSKPSATPPVKVGKRPPVLLASLCGFITVWGGGRKKASGMKARLQKALKGNLEADDFILLAVQKGLQELEQTGVISLPYTPNVLGADLSRRMAELDRVMRLEGGVAEVIIQDTFNDLLGGDGSLIYNGWDFDNPAESRSQFISLVRKWRKELGMSPLPNSKLISVRAWGLPTRERKQRDKQRAAALLAEKQQAKTQGRGSAGA